MIRTGKLLIGVIEVPVKLQVFTSTWPVDAHAVGIEHDPRSGSRPPVVTIGESPTWGAADVEGDLGAAPVGDPRSARWRR